MADSIDMLFWLLDWVGTRNNVLDGGPDSRSNRGKVKIVGHGAALWVWVLSHWMHFTVHSLELFVFICVYFVLLFFILHICCVIVSTVGWI